MQIRIRASTVTYLVVGASAEAPNDERAMDGH
jgi:hypothetical protein